MNKFKIHTLNTVVIGSGAAGYNAADCLYNFGQKSVAVITNGRELGTSRNTGSDKQTYYKMSLAADSPDSIDMLAKSLLSGGGKHSDLALAEAASSAQCFFKLVELGVPFPSNEFGEYVGYQTDHDVTLRATSAGPLTSKYMTEKLEQSVISKGIPVYDNMMAVKLIVENNAIKGVIALDTSEKENKFTIFLCENVVMCTGGPAGIYQNTVFPPSAFGMSGIALREGARAENLQEWQYGIASTKFRWNLSGTYQQVLPRYISVDKDGNEDEFLPRHFESAAAALDAVFLKGYEWPFDVKKIEGSSVVDRLVGEELQKGKRVFLDFINNPAGLDFKALSTTTRDYLSNSGACFGTPIQRLVHMNQKAVQLYLDNGIDLTKEPLEIGVVPQHNNGGIAVDANWQTNISGLYAAGEAAATSGVYRPGGSALSAGQTGSMRAARHISRKKSAAVNVGADAGFAAAELEKLLKPSTANVEELKAAFKEIRQQMNLYGAHIRDAEKIRELKSTVTELVLKFDSGINGTNADLPAIFKIRDALLTTQAVLSAMEQAAEEFGSRGGALVTGSENADKSGKMELCMVTELTNDGFASHTENVRPLPSRELWFENVYNACAKEEERND